MPRKSARPGTVRIAVERLEDRTTPALFTVGTATSPSGLNNNGHVVAADFNGDGNQDIVVTNYGLVAPGSTIPGAGQKLSVMLGNGTGGFGSPSHLTVGTTAHVTFVAVGDVTGDGTLDLVCSSSTGSMSFGTAGTEAGMLTVFPGGAFGTFGTGTTIPTGGSNSAWVGLADLTGDGKLDAVVCSFGKSDDNGNNLSGNNMTVFQNNGTGSLSLINTVSTGIAFIPTSGVLADFDGDSKVDIATTVPGVPSDANADQPEGFVQLFAGNGAGGFTAGNAPPSGGPLPIAIVAADVNADSKIDLVVTNVGNPDSNSGFANFGSGTAVGVLMNGGNGAFANPNVLTAGLNSGGSTGAFASAVADFDLDNKLDIATITYGHPSTGTNARVAIFRGAGGGNFTPDVDSPYNTVTTDGQYLAAANFGGSSAPDLVVVGASNKLNVLTNTSTAAAATTTTLTAPANPTTVTFPANVTFTATVTGGVPDGGTVTFLRGAVTIGTGTVTAGAASFTTTTPIPVGSHTVTARYEGTAGFAASTSGSTTLTVSPAVTSTTVISSSDPSVFGQAVTFSATITSAAGNPTSGTVNFFDGVTQIGTGTLTGTNVATFQSTTLTVGAHPITATFVASGNFATSTSPTLTQDVTQAATTVTLGSSADPSNFGDTVTFTATVGVVAPGGGTLSGMVEFREGATVLGSGTVTGGVATFQTSTLSVGAHPITAVYLTSTNHTTSSSTVLTQDVNAAAVAVTLGSSADPSNFGQTVTFTATITSAIGNPTSGTVEFRDNGALLGTGTLTGTNVATFQTTALAQGVHPITATFLATGSYAQGVSGTLQQDVNPPVNTNTATSVQTSGTPSVVTQTVTFTATVNPPLGGPTPTGTVTFFVDNVQVAGPVALTGSTAQFTTNSLAVGSRTVRAEYTPTGLFNASSGQSTHEVIVAPTGVGIGTSSTPSFIGQTVTFTATVTANPASMLPTGSVVFLDNGNPVSGAVALVNNAGQMQAVFQTSTLGVGSHQITAQYAANGNFDGNTSAPLAQVVNKIGTTIVSIGTLSQPVTAGQPVTFSATLSANAPFSGMPTGVLTFKVDGVAIGTGVINGATATITTSSLTAGTRIITAEFGGDATFDPSVSGNLTQIVTPGGVSPPPPPPVAPPVLVGFREFGVGAGAGGTSVGQFYNPNGTLRFSLDLFPGFTGGVRVTSADFNADGVADMVAGTGPGGASRVRVLNGVTQAEMFAVDPFEAAFVGGVYVSTGDLNGDGRPELLISPDEGGGPRVRVFDGTNFGVLADFFGIDDPAFRGGARTHVGDVNGDGVGDLAVAAGFGGGPRVSIISGPTVSTTRTRLFNDFFVFEEALRNGAFIAVGDVDGDGKAEVLAGGGPGGGPRVTGFSAAGLLGGQYTPVVDFFAGNVENRGGVRLVARDLDGDALADIVVGDGTGAGSRVTAYLGKNLKASSPPATQFSFEAYAGFLGGVYVG